jgi:hypothetical protein
MDAGREDLARIVFRAPEAAHVSVRVSRIQKSGLGS